MIRFRKVTLDNFKNIHYGEIAFTDTRSGGSVLGIYGQNGSGKTSVVDALFCLKCLMSQRQLPAAAADYIGSVSDSATISVEMEFKLDNELSRSTAEVTAGKYKTPFKDLSVVVIEYTVSFSVLSDGKGVGITSESLSMSAKGVMKRVLVAISSDDDSESPKGNWRSLRALMPKRASLGIDVARYNAITQGLSFVFSEHVATACLLGKEPVTTDVFEKASVAGLRAYFGTALPLTIITMNLWEFARSQFFIFSVERAGDIALNKMHVSSYRGNAWSFLESMEVSNAPQDIVLSINAPAVVSADTAKTLHDTVDSINRVLGSIVPGLALLVHELGRETRDDGSAGVRVEVLSVRDGVRVPFRAESEGIKKIVSMLSLLIDVYNISGSCLVVDEFDSGIFEFLLGEILEVMAQRGKGQLIFTAHNLRALECLPSGCLVFTTVNPDDRFIRFKGLSNTSNLRDQYLRAINLGGQKEHVYNPTDRLAIDSAFYDAGHQDAKGLDELLRELGGSDGEK